MSVLVLRQKYTKKKKIAKDSNLCETLNSIKRFKAPEIILYQNASEMIVIIYFCK